MTAIGNPLVVQRSALGRIEPLATGGTAKVYRCPDLSLPGLGDLVFKEYKPKTRQSAGPSLLSGLLSLAQFRESLTRKQREGWDRKLIWPLRVVVEGNEAVGILMKLIPREYFITVRTLTGSSVTKPAEIDMVLGSDLDAQRFDFPRLSVKSRLTLCSQIVATYALVHQRGLIVGDVSARNLVFNDGALGPRTLLVDCDSFRVIGKRAAFGNQPHTGSWEPPEALEAAARLKAARRAPTPSPSDLARYGALSMTQSKETDVYKIGLLIVRILDHGRNKSRNRNPAEALRIIDGNLPRGSGAVLRAALDPDPKNRPGLLEWHGIWHGKPAKAAPVAAVPAGVPPAVTGGGASAGPASPLRQQVSSNWEWVAGSGWTRRPPGSAAVRP
jgi:hypothetical protein